MSVLLYEHSSVMILSIHNIHVKFIQIYTHDTGVYTLGTATMLLLCFPHNLYMYKLMHNVPCTSMQCNSRLLSK